MVSARFAWKSFKTYFSRTRALFGRAVYDSSRNYHNNFRMLFTEKTLSGRNREILGNSKNIRKKLVSFYTHKMTFF